MEHDHKQQGPGFQPLLNPPEKMHASSDYYFAFKERKILLICNNNVHRLPSVNELKELGAEVIREQYIGEFGDISCFTAEIDIDFKHNEDIRFEELRKLYDILGEPVASLAGRAIQLLEWDIKTGFCGRCGSKTFRSQQEKAKECPECGSLFFPKISPAIIVLIEKEDMALLARSPGFPSGLYGLIAGFVEPGESVEEAVVREVLEEVGVSIKDIKYFGSQPWPYPDSLMIGFTARYAGGEIRMDTVEIEDARWFKCDEIPTVPGNNSISGRLISYFIEKHTQ
jgi:NAD+ diphosphatase